MTGREMLETDIGLLELAAKVAGKIHYGEHDKHGGLKTTGGWWNPIADDGDALRLAVKLYLWEPIRLAHRDVTVGVDIYAATRRAIVRSAAEIVRQMP